MSSPSSATKQARVDEIRHGGQPEVLVFTLSYFPSIKGGGPSRSIAGLVEHLSGEFSFRIITTDRDDRHGEPYHGVSRGAWTSFGRATVRYCPPGEWRFRAWRRLLCSTPCDLYYFNSMFSWMTAKTLVLRRFGLLPAARVIVAPRGEFAPGALALKGFKKRLYLKLVSLLRLLDGVTLQASTEMEKRQIEARLSDIESSVIIAMDLSPPAKAGAHDVVRRARRPKVPGVIRLVLIGRIAPMKNIDFALDVLSGMSESIYLDIIGPVEDSRYWDRCRAAITRVPPNVRVTYIGEVAHEHIGRILPAYDAFLLPSRGENYCHAIVEALGAGLPVLISDRTPWNDVGERGAGWVFSLEGPTAARRCISEAAALDEPELEQMRRGASAFATEIVSSEKAVQENRAMFRAALDGLRA